jgi:hypothetical protein
MGNYCLTGKVRPAAGHNDFVACPEYIPAIVALLREAVSDWL